jgi:hypothetical protein
MQRIRAGVTGLGLVFLIVLLGSLAVSREPQGPQAAEPGEPLSELGVAPAPQRNDSVPERATSGRSGFSDAPGDQIRI